MQNLLDLIRALTRSRSKDEVLKAILRPARSLLSADGVSFILRENDYCSYEDEDAVSSLWKGQKFPMSKCISGWAMLNRKSVSIADVRKDDRIPQALYASTFVRGLAMAPIRSNDPLGAIGVYWANCHEVSEQELKTLETLADATSFALENLAREESLKRQTEICEQTQLLLQSRETELEHNRQFLQAAFKLGKLGAWSVDIPDMRHRWSEEARLIHGVNEGEHPSVEELIDFYPEPDRSKVRQAFSACAQDGLGFDLVLQFRNAKGLDLWVRSNGEALRDMTGKIYRVQGGIQDVTEQVEAQNALTQSELRYRHVFHNGHTVMLVIDPSNRRIVDANPAAEAFYGYDRDTLCQMLITEINTFSQKEISHEIEMARRLERNFFQFQHRLADGSIRDVEVYTGPIEVENRPLLFSIVHDVTDRVAMENSLRLRSKALEATANMIVITNRGGLIEWANPAFTESTGYSLEEAVGHEPGDLLRSGVHDEAYYTGMWETISSGNVWHGEITNRKKSGELYIEEMTITPLLNTEGAITHFIAIKQDITEKKKIQEQLFRAQRMESIGTLAGGIAHDINNILSPILLSAGILRMDESNDRKLAIIDGIEKSAKRGSDLIKQVLGFARGMENRKILLNPQHIAREIRQIIKDTFPKNIDCTLVVNKGLKSVLADPTHVHQILMNLCVNARDAMPNGGRLAMHLDNFCVDDVFAVMHPDASPGVYVRTTIIDTGTGIPSHLLHRIFDPFYTTKKVGHGTGLGLSTVQTIVRDHGGFILCHSVEGKGTAFEVYLPSCDSSLDDLGEISSREQDLNGHGELILVVDDEAPILDTSRMVLESHGYRSLLASHGAEAIRLFVENRTEVAVIILDMEMPVMDGLATITALQAIQPGISVLASSGNSSKETVDRVLQMGAVAFLTKPYSGDEFLLTLQQALQTRPEMNREYTCATSAGRPSF